MLKAVLHRHRIIPGHGYLALICEELLQRLLILGFKEIRISLKGLLFKYIVISTAGERMDPWAAAFWQPGHSETGSETETEGLALICEELLQRLLILGFKEIRISLKGLLFKYIVCLKAMLQ